MLPPLDDIVPIESEPGNPANRVVADVPTMARRRDVDLHWMSVNLPKWIRIVLMELRLFLAEFVATFLLTFVGAGSIPVQHVSAGILPPVARSFVPGLVVLAMIYSVGHVSGAHLNPGATFTFLLRGVFPWWRVPIYWAAQFGGAVCAALYIHMVFGTVGNVGATYVKFATTAHVYAYEVVLSFFLYFVILSTSTGNQLVGHNAGVAVGLSVATLGVVGDPLGTGPANPARSLGPAWINGDFSKQWIFIAGPATAAPIAVIAAFLLHGKPKPHEFIASEGKGRRSLCCRSVRGRAERR
eukprot:ANDGO_07777.mRNA.1 Aquaporin NIP2-1